MEKVSRTAHFGDEIYSKLDLSDAEYDANEFTVQCGRRAVLRALKGFRYFIL